MATSPLEIKRNRWTFTVCAITLTVAHYVMLQNFDIPWHIAITDSVVTNITIQIGCVLVLHGMSYYRPGKARYFSLFTWCLLFSFFTIAVIKLVLRSLFDENEAYIDFLMKSMPIRFHISFLIMGSAIILSMLWYDLEDKKIQASLKADAEKLARDAELYKLRQQLQPHFLFNSLNSISALAGRDPEQARKMIQQLSDFLRGALKKEDHDWISLADEIQHLQLYLDMEKVRFGHRLTTEMDTDETCLRVQLPPMLLQPIVENAIKFGLYDTTGDITITIAARTKDNYLELTVKNPFDPETSTPKRGTGFGLSSVERRLFLLFGRNDLLSTSAKDNIFSTTVKIPINDSNSSN